MAVLSHNTQRRLADCVPHLPRTVMAHLYRDLSVKSLYTDRKFEGGQRGWQQRIEESTTLYIGNLSFYTTEEQLYALFGRVGQVKRIVMGLDKNTKTPCGFCFVEYFRRADTEDAVRYLGGCKLDDRIVRVDWDGGFVEGRQYGRGRSGGQVREEYRTDYDAGRGGWGKAVAEASPGMDGGWGGGGQGGVLPQPRRFSMPGGKGGGGNRDRYDPMRAQQRSMAGGQAADRGGGSGSGRPRDDEPDAKRSRQEINPRFREARREDDDED